MARRPDPRLVALLGDACWMVYRLFGVSARPRFAGQDHRDLQWESQDPWVCHYIHTGEPWRTERAGGAVREGGFGKNDCVLSRFALMPPGRVTRGRCKSGLTYLGVPFRLGPAISGTLVIGPYLQSPPDERGFRAMCDRLAMRPLPFMRWAYLLSPVLPPEREAEVLGFCRTALSLLARRFGRLGRGDNWQGIVAAGREGYESVYAPLRFGEDFPLAIFGVFIRLEEMAGDMAAPQTLSNCRLFCVDNGQYRLSLRGRRVDLMQGDAILMLPRDRVSVEPAPGSARREAIVIDFIAPASMLAGIAGVPRPMDQFQSALLARMTELAANLGDLAHRNSEVKLLLGLMLVSMITAVRPWRASGRIPPAPWSPRRSHAVRQALRLLEGTPEGGVADLARRLGLGPSTLRRLFRKEVGVPPAEYRRRQLASRARLLLRRGGMSITEIARQLGYASIHHFSASFRKRAGMSPRDYMRSQAATIRNMEQARSLLDGAGFPPAEIASRLGFSSVHSFAQAFKRQFGVSPAQYARSAAEHAGGKRGK